MKYPADIAVMLHILGNQTQFMKNCGSSYEIWAFITPSIEREKKENIFFAYMPAINYYPYFWRNNIDAHLYVRYYAWKHILMDVVGEDRIILSLAFVVSRFSNLMLVLQISCIMFGKCYIIIMIPQ